MIRSARIAAALLPLPLGACSVQTYQSIFSGDASAGVRQFNILFVIFLAVCAVMYLLVIAFLVAGIARRRRSGDANVVESGRHHESDPVLRTTLIGWGALIAAGLIGLAIADFITDRLDAQSAARPKLTITVTGNQWWWDVEYNPGDTSKMVRTANEIHLPLGVPTRIVLHSNDVIHSFWVPSLTGKQDLIPGRETDVTIVPRKVGIYRGQCAEFCGAEHAKMALVIDVDSAQDFINWWKQQLRPAFAPTNPLALSGYRYVTQRQCALCHNISGTPAGGSVGPDLTHLASRRTIAAGALPMSEGNLYGWVANPQSIKPGNHMPTMALEPDQIHAVVAYLETLK